MKKSVYETNFDRIVKLGIFSDSLPSYKKSKVSGFMDLTVERLSHLDEVTGQKGIAISLTHYFEQNGDLCKDPDMVIVVYPALKSVEVYSFEMSIPPLYQVVFPAPGKVYLKLRNDLNSFLRDWLNNLIDQGHGNKWLEKAENLA